MARVISDTGPLIALAKVDSLFIPKELFSGIRIPEAVWFECRRKAGEDSRRIERAANEGWLEVVSLTATRWFSPSLGNGEIEAMQLALETKKAMLLMDDRLARREAMRHGLDYIGTVRMLNLAQHRSIIDSAEATIRRMADCGYRISPLLLKQLKAQRSGDVSSPREPFVRRQRPPSRS